jgi:hypothetical protein
MIQANSRRHRINWSMLSAMRNVFATNLLGIVFNIANMNIFGRRRCGYAE